MTRKTAFFEGWCWFKFNNLGLALGANFTFYTSLSKGLKLKVRKFCVLSPAFVEGTWEKRVGGLLPPPPPLPIYPEQGWKLMKIKELYSRFCSFCLYPGILNTEKKPSSHILKSRSAIDLDRVKKNRKHNFFSLICIGLHAKFKSIRWHLLPEEL